MHLHLLYYIKNILLTSLLTFTIYIIIYLIYITQNYKLKLQVEDQYEKLLYKELSAINNVYKANLPIILSRNNTSITIYKKNKINIITNLTHKFFNNFIKRKRKILIAVHSHNSLFYHRYVFRKVYRRYKDIQLLFFMGLDYNNSINNLVYEEMKIYRDIVIFDFYCNYHNLHYQTYKFLLWIKDYKHLYKVIIKQDTDTFINIHLLNLVINDLIYKNNSFVFGRIWYYNDIKRKYPSGMSYIFLSKSINKLLCNIDKEFKKLKEGYPEDMFFGILARKANFSFIDSYISFNYTTYLFIPNIVFDANKVFMIHWMRISEIAFLHYNITINNK